MEFRAPALLSDEEMAEVLKLADDLAKWAADVYAFATDEEEVAEAAKAAGYTDIYKSILVGITEMEN